MVSVIQKPLMRESYSRMVAGEVRIWADMLFPAGQGGKGCVWEWGSVGELGGGGR